MRIHVNFIGEGIELFTYAIKQEIALQMSSYVEQMQISWTELIYDIDHANFLNECGYSAKKSLCSHSTLLQLEKRSTIELKFECSPRMRINADELVNPYVLFPLFNTETNIFNAKLPGYIFLSTGYTLTGTIKKFVMNSSHKIDINSINFKLKKFKDSTTKPFLETFSCDNASIKELKGDNVIRGYFAELIR